MRITKILALCVLLHGQMALASENSGVSAFDMDSDVSILEVNGMTLPVLVHGNGPAVMLLHGFPDSRHVWRYQVQALAAAGYTVIAPDQRGFGDATRPDGVEHYGIQTLAADILGIMDHLGVDKAHLVGHDFGAGLAWFLAAYNPGRFLSLTVMSVGSSGNPGWDYIKQREASWYFDFFNKAGLAEKTLMEDDWDFFRRLTRNSGDQERFIRDLARPGALTAALNWYRANTGGWGGRNRGPNYPLIDLPVMGVWSSNDPFLLEPQMQQSRVNVSGSWRYERVNDAGHWFMLEKPGEVNRLLISFINNVH